MSNSAYANLLSALSAADLTSHAVFEALDVYTRAIVGAKMFTVTSDDQNRMVATRLYSSHPHVYPVHGEKPYERTEWDDIVTVGKRTFVANDIAAIAKVFPDAGLIQSVGCEAAINVPIVIGGKVVATLNCSHEAGYYTDERVQASELLKLPGALCLLMHKKLERELAA